MRPWLALTAVLCLAGCSPALTEGRYTCPDGDEACPPGWFCHSDRVCRAAPEGASDSGVPSTDAPGLAGELEPCGSDAQCASGVCNLGSYRRWPVGYCTRSCADIDDGRCDGLSSRGLPICNDLERLCVIACDDADTTCPVGLACVARGVRSSPTDTVYAECFSASAPIGAGEPCMGAMDCGDPDLECVEGWCARACSTRAGQEMACPTGEVCTMNATRGEICRPS